jgi:bifunctional DNase/RNase
VAPAFSHARRTDIEHQRSACRVASAVPRRRRSAPSPALGSRSGAPGRAETGPLYWPNPDEERRVQEMVIYGVSFDMVGKQPIVLLKTVESNKFLPIWIGHPEAAAILMKLQGASTPRPMTHDLLSEMLGELEVECTKVAVTELRENTFYAAISLRSGGREFEIDSRPSDALALAVRAGAPIFAADEVISESAIEFEHEVEDTEEVVEKFKDFLDRVTPEDFASDE